MLRVDAMADTAQVVELKSIGYQANEVLVGPTVGENHLPFTATDSELDVTSCGVDVGSPEPALTGSVDSREEACLVVAVDTSAFKRVPVAVPALVMDVAPASAHGNVGAVTNGADARHIESLHAHMLAKAKA